MSGRARGALWTALVAASVLAPAPVASAATVFLEAPAPWTTTHALRYTAAPGERNNLSLAYRFPTRTSVRIADMGAVIEPGPSCRAVDPHTVDCSVPAGHEISPWHVTLLDGDDRFRSPAPPGDHSAYLLLDAGPGRDTLYGIENAYGELRGGDDDDRLIAADVSSALFLHGDAGADRLSAGDSGDYLLGGSGADDLEGGDGNDVMYGGEQFDPLDPADRGDSLEGGAGDDRLTGGPGTDATACGLGRDVISVHARRDLVPFDCETVAFVTNEEFGTQLSFAPRPFAALGDRLLFRVPCAETQGGMHYDVPIPCRGSLTLREAGGLGRLLAYGSMPRDVGSARLTPLGRRLARRRYGVLATVTLHGDQIPRPGGWSLRLRLR